MVYSYVREVENRESGFWGVAAIFIQLLPHQYTYMNVTNNCVTWIAWVDSIACGRKGREPVLNARVHRKRGAWKYSRKLR